MWIPYFLWEFWESETPDDAVRRSESDSAERNIVVWFLLENPTARVRYVDVRLTAILDKAMTDRQGRRCVVRFQPNEEGLLQAVGFTVKDIHPKAAFRYCFDKISQVLSTWSLSSGSGFGLYGATVEDVSHGAKWKIVPQRVAPSGLELPDINMSDEHAAVLSLYREARNTSSPFYRLLCCYKILEAWYKLGSVFGAADRMIREESLTARRPRRTIDREMLVMSLVFDSRPEFNGLSFREFFERLADWRAKVAHAVTEFGDFVNLDQYGRYVEIGPVANLTDMVARQVLLDEFDLWARISSELEARKS